MNNYSSQSASYWQEELKKVVHKSFEVRGLRTSHQIRELTLELQNIGDEIIVYVNVLRLLVEDNILNEIAEEGVALMHLDPFLESMVRKKEDLLEELNRFSTRVEAISNDIKHRVMMEDDDGFVM
ncbi:hypothetical protein OEA41_009309 [Lepraria neglecta]|uniref:Uncharacterized protein n=1 Tax=Lepraria neglecta TaxID=209136 RepID=A0AAD9Z1K1_9LECA|nr:hypothetical protein OEA41_009309 [Lepraria neglecta]